MCHVSVTVPPRLWQPENPSRRAATIPAGLRVAESPSDSAGRGARARAGAAAAAAVKQPGPGAGLGLGRCPGSATTPTLSLAFSDSA